MTVRSEVVREIAKGLIERVKEDAQKLKKVSQLLGLLYRLYKDQKDFRGFILSPTIPKNKKVEFLKKLRERMEIDDRIDEVLIYLLEINALPRLGEIKRIYDHESEKHLKISRATLFLASKMKEEDVERIKTTVRKFTGRDYEFEVVEDPELIGGFLLKSSSLVLDASVRRNLENLLRS